VATICGGVWIGYHLIKQGNDEMKKILFTDLDGTLLNNESRVVGEMRQALIDMCKAGHVLVLSSGRPLDSILEVMQEVGLDFPGTYIIANNGTLIYDCDNKKPLKELRVDYEDVSAIWNLAKECGIHVQTYTDTHIVSAQEDKEVQYYRRRIHLPLLLAEEPLSVLRKEPYKVLCIDLEDHDRIAAFQSKLHEQFGERLQTVFSNPNYLEIFAREAGKGNGLKFVCDYLNVPIEYSIAAGDAQNDISMLEVAGLSVAMCNGDEDIKAMADIVTKRSNHECGLADVVYEYIL